MKLKINCDSPLLQETLEIYLKDFLDSNGIVISDNPEKGTIIIGRDIKKPFTKTSLMIQLEKYFNINMIKPQKSFEEKLDELLENFKKELKNLIKEFYVKK